MEEEIYGVDSVAYAFADCEFCAGSGYVAVDDGGLFPRQDICGCVLENRRRHAVDVRLRLLFGERSQQMSFRSYSPGDSEKNQAALTGCLRYVERFEEFREEGIGFALSGTYGCGKTHLATATLQALTKRWPGRGGNILTPFSISTPELFRLARNRMNDNTIGDVLERAMKADVCLLDDIGAEYHKDNSEGMSWVDEQLFLILDYRLDEQLPIIYTTNLRKSEMNRLLDPRIVRRLDTQTAAIWTLDKVAGADKPKTKFSDILSGREG